MNEVKTTKEDLILISFLLLFVSAPLMYLQANMINDVLFTVADIKSWIGVLLAIVIIKDIVYKNEYSKEDVIAFFLFLLFLLYNFACILYYSSDYVGFTNSIKAFLYNYSLFIFFPPIYFISDFCNVRRIPSLLHSFMITFITIYSIHAILQYISNKYLFFTVNSFFLLRRNGIKFDHIEGRIRANSIMKSPLEFGIYNTLTSLYFLARILNTTQRREKLIYTFLYIITSVSVFTTLSRTAIVIYGISIITLLGVYYHKWLVKHKKIIILAIALLFVCAFAILMSNYNIFSPLFSPKNLLIRFEIWSNIIDKFSNIQEVMTGFGKVQNGDYGWYHAIIVDNIYLGILLTGGALGLLLFLVLMFLTISKNIIYTNSLLSKNKIYGNAATAFVFGFLCGGLTENLMHHLYFVLIPFILVKMLLFYEKRTQKC